MKKAALYIFISAFLFSTMEIMLKTISDHFSSIQITFTRFLIGGIILIPFAIRSIKNRNIKMSYS